MKLHKTNRTEDVTERKYANESEKNTKIYETITRPKI